MQHSRGWLLSAACVAAVALSGCGSADDEEAPKSDASRVAAPAELARAATDAGAAAAEGEGGDAGQRRIGYVAFVGAQESAARIVRGGHEAAKTLGWEQIDRDAEGDPRKGLAAVRSLINENVDAIITMSIPQSVLKPALDLAREKGIPVVNTSGGVEVDQFSGSYVPRYGEWQEALTPVMAESLAEGAKIATLRATLMKDFEQLWGGVEAAADEHGWSIATRSSVDLADLVPGAQRAVRSALTQHPDLAAVWGDVPSSVSTAAAVLRNQGKCGEVRVFGFGDDLQNLEAIRGGCADAIAVRPLDVDAWVAYDRLAQYFARDAEFPDGWAGLEEIYDFDLDPTQVITKSNLPSSGQYPDPKADFPSFFEAKWGQEFGLGEQQ